MLGLPSTTDVDRKLPKEAFYRNLKLAPAVKESFVRDVESVTVANSVKATTANIAEGEKVHELLVMHVALKGKAIPKAVIEIIDGANPGKKLFVCTHENEGCLAVWLGKLVVGDWLDMQNLAFDVRASTLDDLWDSMASQAVFGDRGLEGLSVEERFAQEQKLNSLREEITALETRARKEKQFSKKNKLFAQARELKIELAGNERYDMNRMNSN